MPNRIELTNEQVSFVKKNLNKLPNKLIGEHIGLSEYKIHCVLKELKLKKRNRVRKYKVATSTFGYFKHENLATI